MIDLMDVIQFLQRNSVVFVFVCFGLIVLWTYWPSNARKLEDQGRIPLDDDR